jgi:hypothetical protein
MATASTPDESQSRYAFLDHFDGPFYQEVADRKDKGRDAKILVTAKDGQTGVGKTNLCDFLGYVLDTSDSGFDERKVTIDPHEFLQFYRKLDPGSATIMEEGEQFDARRAQTNENVDATQKWQMARVREIVALVNLPSPQEIDTRFERLADYWINVQRRGRAKVYKKRIHPIKKSIYYETLQSIEWPNMDESPTFRAMDTLKNDLLDDGDHDANWVREDEVQSRVETAEREARKEVRNEWITAAYEETELTQEQVASLSACDVGQHQVSRIARE